ncbi:MAG: hypothetical protein P1U56_22660 [Saprospiraceae bacterium]|nr:hypothetical protein [Saprospiraceae bacterium]
MKKYNTHKSTIFFVFFLFFSLLISCKQVEPHGVYYKSSYKEYEHFVIDFFGSDIIRVFAIKDGELVMSKGSWIKDNNSNINITTYGNQVKDDLLPWANSFLTPYANKEFEIYSTGDFNIEMKIRSFEELEELKSKIVFKAYDFD